MNWRASRAPSLRHARDEPGRPDDRHYRPSWTTPPGSAGSTRSASGKRPFTAQYTRPEFLGDYDARFVIVTQGPIGEALAYKRRK